MQQWNILSEISSVNWCFTIERFQTCDTSHDSGGSIIMKSSNCGCNIRGIIRCSDTRVTVGRVYFDNYS